MPNEKYIIVESATIVELINEVNEAMIKGYDPIGGVVICPKAAVVTDGNTGTYLVQAMVIPRATIA